MWPMQSQAENKGVAQFIDESDLRRPNEMPRMGERYTIPGIKATWYVPRRRLGVKAKPTPQKIKLVDISVAGALVESVPNAAVEVGSRLRFVLDGTEGVAEIRNVRLVDGLAYYGISYFSMDDDQKSLVHRVVSKVREANDLTSQWERRKF